MEALKFNTRNVLTGEIINNIGVYSELMNKYALKIIHPIINGYVCKGICYTNAFNIKNTVIKETVLDLATGKKYKIMNYYCKNKVNGNNTDLCELKQCEDCKNNNKL